HARVSEDRQPHHGGAAAGRAHRRRRARAANRDRFQRVRLSRHRDDSLPRRRVRRAGPDLHDSLPRSIDVGGPALSPPPPPPPRLTPGPPPSRAQQYGAPTRPPTPPALVAPRVTRGAPRSRAQKYGAPTRPPTPPSARRAPSESWRSSVSRSEVWGPDTAPHT